MAFSLSGNAGIAGATVGWSGSDSSNGSTTADSSGNYSATGVLNSGVSYTITATLALYNFSPASHFFPDVTQDLNGINFTAKAIPNAAIVQKAVQINTTGGDTVSASFSSNLTSGNGMIVAVVGVDTGAAIGTDVQSTSATSYFSVTDSQGNTFATTGSGPVVYGDRTNGKTFYAGLYYINLASHSVSGAADTVTFSITPISSASNCVVGVVAYEAQGFYSNGSYSVVGTPSDTAASPYAGENGSLGAYPGVFPPQVIGNITTEGTTYGSFDVVCAAATTTDGSTFNVGSEKGTLNGGSGPIGELGWTLDGSAAALVNGTFVALAAQSEFCTGTNINNPCEFGTTPSTDGIASVATAMGFATANSPSQAQTYGISGNVGVAGATVNYSGQSAGSVTANGSGNYSISGLSAGNYTITPSLSEYTFSPTSQSETISSANITGVNFTATASSGAWSPMDSRDYGSFPLAAVLVQGSDIYALDANSSNPNLPPTDSRKAGAPKDCRVSAPQNSRVAPPFGEAGEP
jgi:hypothetical protein